MNKEEITSRLLALHERLTNGEDVEAVHEEAELLYRAMSTVPGYFEALSELPHYRDDPGWKAWDDISDAWVDACVDREAQFRDHINAVRSSTPDLRDACYVLDVARRRSLIAALGPVVTSGLTNEKMLAEFDEAVTHAISLAAARSTALAPLPGTRLSPETQPSTQGTAHTRPGMRDTDEAESAAEHRLENARTAMAELDEHIWNLTTALRDVQDELTGGLVGTGVAASTDRGRRLQERARRIERQVADARDQRAALERETDQRADALTAARSAADAASRSRSSQDNPKRSRSWW